MAGLFQQLHLLLNVAGRFGASAAGSVIACAGIGRRRREERRSGRHEEVVMLMVRMSVVVLRLRWLIKRVMAASCCGQAHADGEGSAHVHHLADHGQSGRFGGVMVGSCGTSKRYVW